MNYTLPDGRTFTAEPDGDLLVIGNADGVEKGRIFFEDLKPTLPTMFVRDETAELESASDEALDALLAGITPAQS